MTPFLSFVAAARNDNYEGDFLGRMQRFLDVLLHLEKRSSGNVEIVIVEWNPPKERQRLVRAITWPADLKEGFVRIITVPEAIHQRFPFQDRVPLLEWVSKNVGIRHAIGDFIAVTNPDIIVSKSLFSFLTSPKNLERGKYYRVNRYDVIKEIPNLGPKDVEKFCASHWDRVETSWGNFLKSEYYHWDPAVRMSIYYPGMPLAMRLRRMGEKFGSKVTPKAQEIHSNASGDFFLMSRDDWAQLRGFPELEAITHGDGLLTYIAWRFLKQVVLEYPVYHQEHTRKDREGKPFVPWAEIQSKVIANARPDAHLEDLTPNSPHWGLGDVDELESVDVASFLRSGNAS